MAPGLVSLLRVTPHGHAATLLVDRTGTEIPLPWRHLGEHLGFASTRRAAATKLPWPSRMVSVRRVLFPCDACRLGAAGSRAGLVGDHVHISPFCVRGRDLVPRSGPRWPASAARRCLRRPEGAWLGWGGNGLTAGSWQPRRGVSSCGLPGFWAGPCALGRCGLRSAGHGEVSPWAAGEGGRLGSVSQVSPARQARAAPAAQAAAKAYPPRAPLASMTCPAAAEPAAVPT